MALPSHLNVNVNKFSLIKASNVFQLMPIVLAQQRLFLLLVLLNTV
jgi:hypothetical protein